MNNKILRQIIEYIWLTISIGSLITVIHAFNKNGFSKDVGVFSTLFLIAFFMYLFRKKQRTQSSK